MRGPNYDQLAKKFGDQHRDRWRSHGQHIGDIEQYALIQDGNFFSMWDQDAMVAFASLSDHDNTVDNVWVDSAHRGQRLFSKLLWFFKTRLNRNPLIIGPVHSPTMQEVVKGLSRFRKSWVNVQTGQREPFDPAATDRYYDSMHPTEWRLMLENQGDFSGWPRFATGQSYIQEDYTAITL